MRILNKPIWRSLFVVHLLNVDFVVRLWVSVLVSFSFSFFHVDVVIVFVLAFFVWYFVCVYFHIICIVYTKCRLNCQWWRNVHSTVVSFTVRAKVELIIYWESWTNNNSNSEKSEKTNREIEKKNYVYAAASTNTVSNLRAKC